jgi:hypothetical protein
MIFIFSLFFGKNYFKWYNKTSPDEIWDSLISYVRSDNYEEISSLIYFQEMIDEELWISL